MPTALRMLRQPGYVGRTPPAPGPSTAPRMPMGLSPEERASWRGLMRELGTVPGLVSQADRGICELVARIEPALRAAAVVVREQGSTIECLDKNGYIKFIQQRAEAAFLLKAGSLLKSAYSELGLTPSGRCRVALTPAAPTSKLDQFLQERHGA